MAKYLGKEVTLAVDEDDAGAGAYAVIGQIMDINGPNSDGDDVDTTTRDNVDMYRSFLGGWKNPGELTFDIVFDAALASHVTLMTLHVARTEVPWKLTWPTGTSKMATFRGYVKTLSAAAPLEDKLTMSVTVKIAAAITWAAAAA